MAARNLLILFFCLAAVSMAAQERLYLRSSSGIGFNNSKAKTGLTAPALTKNTVLGIGYQKNKWRAESGIGYIRTGANASQIAGTTTFFDTARLQKFYYSIIIPFRISYQLQLNNRFSLNPALGVALNYSTGTQGKQAGKNDVIKSTLRAGNKMNLLGESQLNGTYKLSDRVDLFGGPAFQYMLTPIGSRTGSSLSEYRQQHYSWMINAGINWYLPRNKVADTPSH